MSLGSTVHLHSFGSKSGSACACTHPWEPGAGFWAIRDGDFPSSPNITTYEQCPAGKRK